MNAVFIHNPKTGGLAIEQALKLWSLRNYHRIKNNFVPEQSGQVSFGHVKYSKLLRKGWVTRKFDESAFKFCFCRNPYDRAVSHWAYTMRKHPDITPPETSFLDFSRNIEHPAFVPQITWIGGVDIDFVGRFENFKEDVYRVADILGVWVGKIPKKNSSDRPPYQECYCPESKERIEEYYACDFKRFGYEYDNFL